MKKSKALSFPRDNSVNQHHITGWEYLAARNTGTIKGLEVKEVHTWARTISFADYVEYFYRIKEHSKPGSSEQLFAKLFLVKLHGKFGQDPSKYTESDIVTQREASTMMRLKEHDRHGELRGPWTVQSLLPEGLCLVSRPIEEERRHSFIDVAVCASVVGFVRAMLWSAICRSGSVIYCDTDSIVSSSPPGKVGRQLGAWKMVMEGIKTAWIGGQKIYCFEDAEGTQRTACLGAALSAAQIKQVAQGHNVRHQRQAPTFSLKMGNHFVSRTIGKRDFAGLPMPELTGENND